MFQEIFQNRNTYKTLATVPGVLFVLLSVLIYVKSETALLFNESVLAYTQEFFPSQFPDFWRLVTTFGSFAVVSFATIVTAVYQWYVKKNHREATAYLVAMFGGLILVYAIKVGTGLPRPTSLLSIEETMSFPSGHTALTGIYAFISGYFIIKDKSKRHKYIVLLLSFIAVFLISFSRLVLHEHWVLDVVGGILLSVSWSSIIVLGLTSKKVTKYLRV